MSLRKIGERTFWGEQGLEPSEYLPSGSRHKAVPNSGHVEEIFSLVIPNNDSVDSVRARNVSSDDKFLSTVQPILGPRPAALANLVSAVLPLGNNAFQPLGANCVEHVSGGCFEIIRNPDSGRLKLENRFHNFMALDKRQAREIAIVVNEKVENEVMDP